MNTGAIARAFGATVVRSDANTGPSSGKNLLAQQTTAAWVHFHDADEAIQPEFVARARTWMARDQADVVLFGTEDRDDVTAELLTRLWDDAGAARDAVAYRMRTP
jgi:glycosyltransferase involved in cell wall biosynthesis